MIPSAGGSVPDTTHPRTYIRQWSNFVCKYRIRMACPIIGSVSCALSFHLHTLTLALVIVVVLGAVLCRREDWGGFMITLSGMAISDLGSV